MRNLIQPHIGAHPGSAGAIHHWKLAEGSSASNAVDAAGSTNLAQVSNPGAAASLFASPPRYSRTFDGAADLFWASTPTATRDFLRDGRGWSVSAAFRLDKVTGSQKFLSVSGTTTGSSTTNALLGFGMEGDEVRIEWEHSTNSETGYTTSGANLTTGVDYLAAASWWRLDSGLIRVRIWVFQEGQGLIFDSGNRASYTAPTAGASTSTLIYMGRHARSATGEYLDGTLEDVVIWRRPLTAEGVRLLYAETYGTDYDESRMYSAGGYVDRFRVWTEDGASGAWVNLCNPYGRDLDFLESWTVEDDVDARGATAKITLAADIDGWSIRPDMATSPLNLSGAALIGLNRKITIEHAMVPEGRAVQDHDYVPIFEGLITAYDYAGESVELEAEDFSRSLADVWISKAPYEITAIDDSGAGGAIQVTTSVATGLVEGERFTVFNTTNYDRAYTVATAGNPMTTTEVSGGSLASESSGLLFPPDQVAYGSTSGTDVEDVIQALLDDNRPSVGYTSGQVPVLYTPTSPAFAIYPYYQDRGPLMDALDALAIMFGGVCRYRWDPSTLGWRLTLYTPNRAASTPDHTWTTEEVLTIDSAGLALDGIRNAVEIQFSDRSQPVDAMGNHPRTAIRVEDAASQGKYGLLLCQVALSSTGQLDDPAEAAAFGQALIDDLGEPATDLSVGLPFRRFIQLGDLQRFPVCRYWSAVKDLAVVGIRHQGTATSASTSVDLRGKPSRGVRAWSPIIAIPGIVPVPTITPPAIADADITAAAGAGKIQVTTKWDPSDLTRRHRDLVEIHASTTSGFKPDASTVVGVNRAGQFEIAASPGATYVRAVYRDRNGVPSRWTAQKTVTVKTPLDSVPFQRAHRSSNQSISAATWTDLVFNDKNISNPTTLYSSSTGYITPPQSGVYMIHGYVECYTTSATSSQYAYVRLNLGTGVNEYGYSPLCYYTHYRSVVPFSFCVFSNGADTWHLDVYSSLACSVIGGSAQSDKRSTLIITYLGTY